MKQLRLQRETLPCSEKAWTTILSSSSKTLSSNSFPSSSSPAPHHTFSELMVEENITNAESIITKWDPSSSTFTKHTSLFYHNRKEAKDFIKSVKGLCRAMHFLASKNSTSNKLVIAQKLVQIAMKRLEEEFYRILSACRNQLDPDSLSGRSSDGSSPFDIENEDGSEDGLRIVGDSIAEMKRVSMLAMFDLRLIADCMISSGYAKECVKIYKLIRKSIVDEGLYRLGIEQYKPSQIQKMNWEGLERVINSWLAAINIAMKTFFNGERVLCDHIFSASEAIRESCFSEITKEGAINLFRLPELVAKSKRSPERIFRLMELYEAISNFWPEIESIFSFESTSSIKLQALSSLLKLGNSVRTILSNFESSIQKESSKNPVPGGGIHPPTQLAMNYISSLADYGEILSHIVADYPPQGGLPMPESYFQGPNSNDGSAQAVSIHLAWLVLILLCKLDNKSELYKDMSLSYLFLANNLHFIVEKVRTTNIKSLLGDDWIFRQAKKVKLYASNYEAMAWTKVFSSFPENNSPTISPEAAKECLVRFNLAFEEVYRKQTMWIVPDGKLRDDLKVSIANKLVPVYQEFYDMHLAMLSGDKNLEPLVRFAPDDLGNYLSDLFHGPANSWSSSSSSSSSSSGSYSRACLPR